MLSGLQGRLRDGRVFGFFLGHFRQITEAWCSPLTAKAGTGPVGRVEAFTAVSWPAAAAVRQGTTKAVRKKFTERENEMSLDESSQLSFGPTAFREYFLTILTPSEVSPWRINPDNIQMAKVNAFFIIPVVAGAALDPDVVWACLRLCCVCQWKSPTWKNKTIKG